MKIWAIVLILSVCMGAAFAYDATEEDLYNSVSSLIGGSGYVYFDHQGVVDVDGFRLKNWGTNANLSDSSRDSWTEELEYAEVLTGLAPSSYYKLYAIAGGKVNSGSTEDWGIRVGVESGNYMLETVDIGDDSTLTKWNLGNYRNETSAVYPYREVQSDINNACMYAVYVGNVATDAEGTVTVFVDDGEFTMNSIVGDRTWYDGLLLANVEEPHAPTPADGANEVAITDNLVVSWLPGNDPNALTTPEFYVYFGTASDNLMLLNTTATTATSYDVGAVDYHTNYYWQIEEITAMSVTGDAGDPNNVASPVWSFQTEYLFNPNLADFNVDGTVDNADFALFASVWLWMEEE